MARPQTDITPDRASRLCKLLFILGEGPQDKQTLADRLALEDRGFYRDLRYIRDLDISIKARKSRYVLLTSLDDALDRLPVPDLKLSMRDVLFLARGESPVHRRLRRKLVDTIGEVEFLKPR
jgi:hypothetical protein